VISFTARATIAAICVASLAGCIDSSSPILPDSQPLFGPLLKLQLYSLRKGRASDPEQVTFVWNGALYSRATGGIKDVSAFSIHDFEAGDYIIQSIPAKRPGITEYAVMHKLVDGVYQINAIDEDDADGSTRSANCGKGEKNDRACRIETRDQLLAFARATAARQKTDGGLAIRLPDGPDKREPQTTRRR
jgi:hypothetical protein